VAARFARHLKFRRGMTASLYGGLASMGLALPYAIAAKEALPTRQVVALLGDGAMQMLGINSLISIAHQWRQWDDPQLVVMVLNNGDLNMVTWEQRISQGDPMYEASQLLPAFPYADYARMLGLHGLRVECDQDVAAAWDEALAADRPVVLDMVTDPNVPPLPPYVTAAQRRNYAAALLQGDPQALKVIIATAKEWWDGLFPGSDVPAPRH
jgi:pyruvate dehydrogenase (quinone)